MATVSALPLTGNASQLSGESSLERFLAMIPAESFQWDDLSFADYQAVRSPFEITASFAPLASTYFDEGKVAAATGFSPGDVRQSMILGSAPSDQVWLKGAFATGRVKAALEKQELYCCPQMMQLSLCTAFFAFNPPVFLLLCLYLYD